MSDPMQKDDCCKGCYYEERSYAVDPCKECSRAFSGMQKDWYTYRHLTIPPEGHHGMKWVPSSSTEEDNSGSLIKPEWFGASLEDEQEFLTKLIDDHWAYIERLIDVTQMHSNPKEKAIAEFHYRSAAVHFWKHCREWMEGR